MEILHCKVVSGCVLFVVTLTCGLGPFILLRRFTDMGERHRNRAAARINSTQAFACGIFIGTCLLHLLPEALEGIKNSMTSDLPVSEMIVAFGFLLLLVTENLILACHDATSKGAHHGKGSNRDRSVLVFSEQSVNSSSKPNEKRSVTESSAHSRSNYGAVSDYSDGRSNQTGSAGDRGDQHFDTSSVEANHNENHPLLKDRTDNVMTQNSRNQTDEDNKEQAPISDIEKQKVDTHSKEEEEEAEKKKAVLKSFVLLFALSLHTVFDGLVVGLQSKQSELWTLLAAVGLHKALISVSIALSLLESHHHHPRASLLYLFLFSLVAPAGLTIGVILTETDFDKHVQTLTSGVLQSVATGTFMYVTFVESLKGRFDGRDRLLNIFWLLIGFGLVCGLRVVLPG